MERLWENDSFVDDNTLTVNVTRLRKKLESIGMTDVTVRKKELDIWWNYENLKSIYKRTSDADLYVSGCVWNLFRYI